MPNIFHMHLLVHVLLDMKVVMSMVIGLTIVGLKPFSEEPLRKTIKIVFVTEQVTNRDTPHRTVYYIER